MNMFGFPLKEKNAESKKVDTERNFSQQNNGNLAKM